MSDIEKIKEDILSCTLEDAESVEAFRIKYIGSKGLVKSLFKEMKNVAPEERRSFGQKLNELKELAEKKINEANVELDRLVTTRTNVIKRKLPGF